MANGVNWPNYRRQFPLINKNPRIYPEWTWDWETRLFSPTPKELLTAELRQRSALAVKKCRALWEISYELSVARYPVWSGLLMQETVYIAKKTQAQRYKDLGCPETDAVSYPYVLQYADFSGLTMRAAADEILFKARLDEDLLSKSEFLRLKYFNLVKDAMTTSEIDPILKRFRTETYGGVF
jgi:hypothetical protein